MLVIKCQVPRKRFFGSSYFHANHGGRLLVIKKAETAPFDIVWQILICKYEEAFQNLFTGKLSLYSAQSFLFLSVSILRDCYNSNLSEAENSIAQKVYLLLIPLTRTTMARNIVVKETFLIMHNGSFRKFMMRGTKTKAIFLWWVSVLEIMSMKFVFR